MSQPYCSNTASSSKLSLFFSPAIQQLDTFFPFILPPICCVSCLRPTKWFWPPNIYFLWYFYFPSLPPDSLTVPSPSSACVRRSTSEYRRHRAVTPRLRWGLYLNDTSHISPPPPPPPFLHRLDHNNACCLTCCMFSPTHRLNMPSPFFNPTSFQLLSWPVQNHPAAF